MGTLVELKDRASTFGKNLGYAAINTLGFETTRIARKLNADDSKIFMASLLEASPYVLLLAGALSRFGNTIDRAGTVMLAFSLKALIAHLATFDLPSGRR